MLSFALLLCALLGGVWLAKHPSLERRRRWMGWLAVGAAAIIAVLMTPPIFVARKLVASFLMPIPLIWIGLLWACWASRGQRRLRVGILIITAALTLSGNAGLSILCVRFLEAPYRSLRPLEQPPHLDAIFVLGGGINVGPDGQPQLTTRGDRLRLPLLLYLGGHTPTLVASGTTLRGVDVSAATRDHWLAFGIPESAIRVIPGPKNTAQEIDAYVRLIADEGWQRVGLVTSATHMRRALALCRQRGIEMEPLPSNFVGPPDEDIELSAFLWPVPQQRALMNLEIVVWEVLGLLALHLMGF